MPGSERRGVQCLKGLFRRRAGRRRVTSGKKTEQEAANLCREKVWVSRLIHFPGIITALVTILYETAVNIFTIGFLKLNFVID